MDFNFVDSLRNAIVAAVNDHEESQIVPTKMPSGRVVKYNVPIESTNYLLANIIMQDGTNVQAQLLITSNEYDFIDSTLETLQIDLEKEASNGQH